jgi:ATP-dependent RNA helicase DeaD
MVDEVVERLQSRAYAAEALHGDISQPQREKVLRAFREGRAEVLVATDVAARGLDVPEVSLVVNFDIPPDPEYYVHRIGRTGRGGRAGEAITLVNPRQMRELRVIERATGARIRSGQMPTAAEVEARDLQMLEERLLTALHKDGWARYRAVIQDLMDEHDPVDLAAAALSLADPRSRRGARSNDLELPRRSERQPLKTRRQERRKHAPVDGPRSGPRARSRSPGQPARAAAGGQRPASRARPR